MDPGNQTHTTQPQPPPCHAPNCTNPGQYADRNTPPNKWLCPHHYIHGTGTQQPAGLQHYITTNAKQ